MLARSVLASEAGARPAELFAVVKRIVETVNSHPPKKLSPKDQKFVDTKLLWGVSEVGRALNEHGATYGVERLSLICNELIAPYPMRMAAAAGPKVMVSLAILILINGRNIPPQQRTYQYQYQYQRLQLLRLRVLTPCVHVLN